MNKELIDLAWSLLPKEFKEYIMKVYKAALECSRVDAHFLENIFGRHSLTSDAEGEEMLTVPRKKVQEIYTQNQNEITRENVSSSDKDCYETVNEVLKTLFGSKCLPDEIEYTTCVHASGTACKHYNNEESHCSLHGECKFEIEEPPLKITAAEDCVAMAKEEMGIKDDPKPAEDLNIDNPFEKRTPLSPETEQITDKMTTEIVETLTQPIKEYFEKIDKKPAEPLSQNPPENCNNGNHISTDDNKPAEPKFKYNIGQKVKSAYANEILTIKEHCGRVGHDNVYKVEEYAYTWNECELQPYTEPIEVKEGNTGEKLENPQSDQITNCDNQFDSIIKDSFRNERRLNIATQIMSAILSNQMMLNNLAHGETTAEGVVRCVVDTTMMYTDALIAEAEKGGES